VGARERIGIIAMSATSRSLEFSRNVRCKRDIGERSLS